MFPHRHTAHLASADRGGFCMCMHVCARAFDMNVCARFTGTSGVSTASLTVAVCLPLVAPVSHARTYINISGLSTAPRLNAACNDRHTFGGAPTAHIAVTLPLRHRPSAGRWVIVVYSGVAVFVLASHWPLLQQQFRDELPALSASRPPRNCRSRRPHPRASHGLGSGSRDRWSEPLGL